MPYLGKQSEQVGVSIQKYEFLQATDTSSGATSFSVPSDAGDHVNVWLNGVLLVEGASNDYTTTNTTVVFGTAPADGDIVRIDVVESFSLPDALKSSGDTMTGPLKLDGGLKQQTSQDLSGTYAYHQMMVSDAFTVAGDVTISDNLILTKISDDSNAITLTDDGSTRTITGTGSLETSTIAQTPNQSLTGMTGEIGSAVTFPTGHVVQTKFATTKVQYTVTSSIAATGLHDSITITSGNKIKIQMNDQLRTWANGSNSWLAVYTYLYRSTDGGSSYSNMHTNGWASHYRDHKDNSQSHIYHDGVYPILWLDENPGAATVHYKLYAKLAGDGGSYSGWLSADSYFPCTIMLEEIQG